MNISNYILLGNDKVNKVLHIFVCAGTVAFEADLNEYTSIPIDSYVVLDQIHLNIGDG